MRLSVVIPSALGALLPTGIYTDGRVVALTKELLDQLGVARTTLVGNSIGGRVAFLFAAAHADRVNGLVLISPAGFASPGFEYGKKPAIPFVARLVRSVLPKRVQAPMERDGKISCGTPYSVGISWSSLRMQRRRTLVPFQRGA